MYKNNSILSFIGARSGSKSIKNKNIIDFAGKPLIHWTIEPSVHSKYIDRTIVSTDSEEIAKVARQANADTPFIRPSEFSQDRSSINDAILHCINWLEVNEKKIYDYIILLMPTSPFRTSQFIDSSIEKYFAEKVHDTDTLVSVKQLPLNYGWIMHDSNNGYIEFCFPESLKIINRQEHKPLYLPSGIFYISSVSGFKKQISFYGSHTRYIITNEFESTDIDTPEDYKEALELYKQKQLHSH